MTNAGVTLFLSWYESDTVVNWSTQNPSPAARMSSNEAATGMKTSTVFALPAATTISTTGSAGSAWHDKYGNTNQFADGVTLAKAPLSVGAAVHWPLAVAR